MGRFNWMWVAGVLAWLPAQAQAQQIPAADFARHAELYDVSLSPSGDRVALAVPTADGRETRLEILPLDGSGKTRALRFAQKQHVINIVWASNDQLVVSRAVSRPFRPQPVSYGELMSSDVEGGHQQTLFGYLPDDGSQAGRRKDIGFARVLQTLPDAPGQVLVEFVCGNCGKESPDEWIYRVDTVTGERTELEHTKGASQFVFDRSGRARFRTTLDADDEPVLDYRPTSGSPWVRVPQRRSRATRSRGGASAATRTWRTSPRRTTASRIACIASSWPRADARSSLSTPTCRRTACWSAPTAFRSA